MFIDCDVFLSLNVVVILANSAEPGDMQYYAAVHLGSHYFPKYPFSSIQRINDV